MREAKIADENWVLTAYNKDAPATTTAPADGTHGSTAVAPGASSGAKLGKSSESGVNKGENVSEPSVWGKKDLLSKAEQDGLHEPDRKHSEKDEVNYTIDHAMSIVTGKDIKQTRADRRKWMEEHVQLVAEIAKKVLQGKFDDVTLQQINQYINEVTPKKIPTDDVYLNDFHREWNERCMKANEEMQSMHFSHAFAKAQSERMAALVRKEREKQRSGRKSSSNSGL